LQLSIATGLYDELLRCYEQLNVSTPFSVSAEAIAVRHLKNTALSYIVLAYSEGHDTAKMDIAEVCYQQFLNADNMTDRLAGLKIVVHASCANASLNDYATKALDAFYQQWQHENLVVNQWLSVQATIPHPSALERVKALMHHESFSMTNPNKVRSLIGAFTQNLVAFHQVSGEGYAFLAEQVIALNTINPQIAARIITPLTRWKKYDATRQTMMKEQLERIKNTDNLSKDVYEVVNKRLGTSD